MEEIYLSVAVAIAIVGNKYRGMINYNVDKFNISSIGKFDTKYKSLLSTRFMVYANPQSNYASVGDKIIFCAGGNNTNYFEYKVTVTNDSSWNERKLITVSQSGASMSAS
jgi:hypothetical protein